MATLQTFLHKWPERQKDYDSTSIAAVMFASRGENAQAEAAIRQTVRNRLRTNASYFVYAQYRIGAAYALLGEKQKALAALSEAANSGLPCYPLYAQDPALNSLRGNPRSSSVSGRTSLPMAGPLRETIERSLLPSIRRWRNQSRSLRCRGRPVYWVHEHIHSTVVDQYPTEDVRR